MARPCDGTAHRTPIIYYRHAALRRNAHVQLHKGGPKWASGLDKQRGKNAENKKCRGFGPKTSVFSAKTLGAALKKAVLLER